MKKTYALITGASGGIGLELAKQFAKNGHNLILVARSHERLKVIASDLHSAFNVGVESVECDLSKPGSAKKLFDQLASFNIEALVNNAGIGMGGKFSEQDPNRLNAMMQLNISTLTELTRLITPNMINNGGGKILNVASTAAFLPGPFMSVYYASKAYVYSFSRALAYELKPHEITVTALCPGPTKTHFAAEAKVEGSRLFSGNLMTAEFVATEAYSALMDGKELIIPGTRNKIMVALLRWLPNSLVMRAVNAAQGGKNV